MLLGVAGAFWAQYTSPIVQTLSVREKGPIRIAVFTKPAMRFAYDPTTRKAVVTWASTKCTPEQKEACFNAQYDRFYIPQEPVQNTFWIRFKQALESWRFNPVPVFQFVHAYINALVQKRTNVRPSEFALLSMELPYLTATDFAIEQPAKKKKTIGRQVKEQSVSVKPEVELPARNEADKPLIVEILNASGKKGLALALTQYLREQNAKGMLRVDVLQYDNYPSQEATSFITDYSGKLVQVTQVSRAIGITNEIRSETSTTAICDTRIVLGKDFEMPL